MNHNFTPTQWSTVADKERFFDQFVKFVESDFARAKFPQWFYKRLSMTFGHIAHYNIQGFYAEFFESTAGKTEFLRQTIEYPCYGDPAFTYSDVERALRGWLHSKNLVAKYQAQHTRLVEAIERKELVRLEAKYRGSKKK